MKPDIITIAKGLTSAYAPLSGSIISDKVWKVLARGTDEFGAIGHGWTYSAHPIGAAAGVANLKLLDDLGLVANAGEVGAVPDRRAADGAGRSPQCRRGARRRDALRQWSSSRTATAAQFFDPPRRASAPRSPRRCWREGVIGRAMPQGDILGFAPPLCLSRTEADRIADATARAVESVFG